METPGIHRTDYFLRTDFIWVLQLSTNMNARTRYFKVFERELKKYRPFMATVIRMELECIPTNKLLSVRKELKRRGSFI